MSGRSCSAAVRAASPQLAERTAYPWRVSQSEMVVTVSALPYPPAGLACSYDEGAGKATLTWSTPENWN